MNQKRINFLVDACKLLLVFFIAFLIVAAIVFSVSKEPMNALYCFFVGPFQSIRRIGNIITGACPLIFTSLAVLLIFGAGRFSMISEGAFFIGSSVAMMLSVSLSLPPLLHTLVCILGGAVAGMLAAAIPAYLRLLWNVSEVVTSIMLNYIIQFFGVYLVSYHFREVTSSSLVSVELSEGTALSGLIGGTNVHSGFLIALCLCLFCWVLIYRSHFGYQLRLTGDNFKFSRYVGVKAAGVIVGAQLLAGAIAGAGGSIELLGMYNRFKWISTPGYGWTGIVVALLARNNPLLVPISACFIAYINTGANVMSMSSDVSSEVAEVIQGVIMLLIASNALLQGWRQRMIVKAVGKEKAVGC